MNSPSNKPSITKKRFPSKKKTRIQMNPKESNLFYPPHQKKA